MEKKMTEHDLADILDSLFTVTDDLHAGTDLARYIQDSIDLGELLAVAKERHGVTVSKVELFKTHSQFSDVLLILNNEL